MANPELASRIGAIMPEVTAQLIELTKIPSIAFPGFPAEPVLAAAEMTASYFRAAGVEDVRLLPLEGGYPTVYAAIPAPPGAPTVLLYAHYDIQPAPLSQGWTLDPFQPERRDGRLYGRGAADDKAGVMMHVATMRLFAGKPPVGVRILIEGEEETGSNLGEFLKAHPELIDDVDAFMINDGGNEVPGKPSLAVALRGTVTCTVTVRTLRQMVHSGGFGGGAPDALMALIRILDQLLDERGDVAIPGLARFEWHGAEVDEAGYRLGAGVRDGVDLIGTGSLATRLWARPSVTVIGLDAPPVAGASNSLIPEARARISLRVAPGSDMAASLRALTDFLRAAAPWNVEVEITEEGYGNAFRAPQGGRFDAAARTALTEVFGLAPRSEGSGGSIPLLGDLQAIKPEAEFIVWGAADEQRSAAHGPDESLDLAELERMITAEVRLLELLGQR